jgi:hypothetical protein
MVDIIGIRLDVVIAHKKERGVTPRSFSTLQLFLYFLSPNRVNRLRTLA